jgi:class 3 adenylate cyclase/tetratricopeptide (TPR) repeat protein
MTEHSTPGEHRQPDNYRQIERAIAALEAQRTVLGDIVVDASIAALRDKLAVLALAEPTTLQLRGERRPATIILADVKGSTALAERVDTETWVEIMNHVFQILGAEIYRYGGNIDQFRGDGLVAFFGVPTAHEDDPERAVLAALAMQEAVKEYAADLAERTGIEILLRVGMNTGEVIAATVGDHQQHAEDTAMGRAIALAARMETAAEPGTVLVTENTYRLVQPLFEWKFLGEISVKGVSEPVIVYRPLAHKIPGGKGRGIAGLSSPLVGREAEFRALQEAIGRLQAGVGGIVTIVGEGGLGKSRLVAEARAISEWANGQIAHEQVVDRRLSTRNPEWIEGRCLSYGSSIAYLLWLDALRRVLGVTQDASPAALRDALRAQVQALCPDRIREVYPFLCRLMSLPLSNEDRETLHGLDGETLKFATFRAIEILIECTAQQRPLILVCEDLHWADHTSLELLERLLALTDHAPLLLVCVFRPETEHNCWRIRETAARLYHHRYTDLWLAPLSPAESGSLIRNLLQVEDLDPAFRQRILEHAEGNPFYVEEILRSLMESEAIVYDEVTGRWQVARDESDIAIPDTLHGVLVARIDRLQRETRRVLQLASVIGRVFFYRVLVEIAQEEHELDSRLLTLQRQQLIRERARLPELEYIFKHHLTQEAAYGGLLNRERRIYHRQVAEAIERLFPDRVEEQVGLLAHHWERAGETERAIDYLRRAGEQAAAHYANEEALDYLTRALDLTPEEDLTGRYGLLLAREGIHDLLGERKAQSQDLTGLDNLVERLTDDEKRAKVALRRANHAWITGDYPTAATAAQAAIDLAQAAQESDPWSVECEAEGYRWWGVLLRIQGDDESAWARLEQALALAKSASLHHLEADILISLSGMARKRYGLAEARTYCKRALRIYRDIGDRQDESRVLNYLGAYADSQGDHAEAKSYYEQAQRTFREIGDRPSESMVLINLGWACAIQGNYSEARTCYEQALRICREARILAREETVLGNLSLLYHRLGNDQVAYDYAQQEFLVARELDSHSRRGYALTNLGHALLGLQRLPEAADAYRRSVALRRELGESSLAMESLAGLANASLEQGDLLQAQAHSEEIIRYLETNPTLYGAEEPFWVYLICARVLRANRDLRAEQILDRAYNLLQGRAAKISDQGLRRSFLENVAAHREIVQEYRRAQERDANNP